jgi:hypothetical protein
MRYGFRSYAPSYGYRYGSQFEFDPKEIGGKKGQALIEVGPMPYPTFTDSDVIELQERAPRIVMPMPMVPQMMFDPVSDGMTDEPPYMPELHPSGMSCQKAVQIAGQVCGHGLVARKGKKGKGRGKGGGKKEGGTKRRVSSSQKKRFAACSKKWNKKSAAFRKKSNYLKFAAKNCK